MFCTKCGKEIKDTMQFCPGCGAKVHVVPKKTAESIREDKTEILLTPSQTPIKTPPQTPPPIVAPAPVQIPVEPVQAHVEPKIQKKQKKSSNIVVKLLIVVLSLILLVCITLIGLFVIKQYLGKDVPDPLGTILIQKSNDSDIKETAGTDVTTEGEGTSLTEKYQKLMEEQDYATVISELLDLDGESEEQEQLDVILLEAVKGHIDQHNTTTMEQAGEGNYVDAFKTLDEEDTYLEELKSDDRINTYLSEEDLVDAKRQELLQQYQNYVYQVALDYANKKDESGVNDIFKEADQYLNDEVYDAEKTSVYAKLVQNTIDSMSKDGKSASDIISYIDKNLNQVDNDCWVLEFWDYFNAVDQLEKGIAASTSKVTHLTNGYILPDSDSKELTQDDIKGLSQAELRLARYEIYARYGRTFNDAAVTTYFSQYDWYQGTIEPGNFDENSLNETEKKNRDLLIQYEKYLGYR